MIRAPWTIREFTWVPNSGPLVISLVNSLGDQLPIGSLSLSKVDVAISFSAVPTPPNGNPFYIATPPAGKTNPQTVPMPTGTTQVTLTATSAETYYVIAASGIFRPLMEGSAI